MAKIKFHPEAISPRISLGAVLGPYDDTPTTCAATSQKFGWPYFQVMTLGFKKTTVYIT
ncbi:Hypothetical predicted protein [Marmota monax]|uniref:Uncharacterized protein n=1 Tax=Marmota monax TaxID=9995 RepID=A0A5E4CC82_MARMO|nr:Hypothetical predicted protein [Marmota monax]